MSRRTAPQKKTDELAFPIRLRFAIPDGGLGMRADALNHWLQYEVGPGDYAVHSSAGLAQDAFSIYLRDITGAQALVEAFPALKLADGTQSCVYVSPAQSGAWQGMELFSVCNLYSMTAGQAAIRRWFDGIDDRTGNLPPLPGIYPDYAAPVVCRNDGNTMLSMMRWGMPSPQFALKGKKTDRGVTNVRNTKSPHWRRWLGVENRCVVPFTSFSEPLTRVGEKSKPVWFALSEDRPLAFFAGIWTEWTSVRKLKDGETTDNLFGFLTTDANAEVGTIHPKAMPVILRTQGEVERWLGAETYDALTLQQPLPDGSLQIMSQG
ncbi:SOS response-associated peptidase [Ascidiaceihabitans sp.]|uniref:SOS response-associated peptidase n=1 Tax=Ascidiaceihabitans sp. TaxID=1872644 RepID=UPI003299793E